MTNFSTIKKLQVLKPKIPILELNSVKRAKFYCQRVKTTFIFFFALFVQVHPTGYEEALEVIGAAASPITFLVSKLNC
jgi:hypothetical protein